MSITLDLGSIKTIKDTMDEHFGDMDLYRKIFCPTMLNFVFPAIVQGVDCARYVDMFKPDPREHWNPWERSHPPIHASMNTDKGLTKRYFHYPTISTMGNGKLLWAELRVMIRVCYVLIFQAFRPESCTLAELLGQFPHFQALDEVELELLVRFRSAMRVALKFIPARQNKLLLLRVCAYVEGARKEYVTGSGAKPAVLRRVDIYEKDGHVTAEKRQKRDRTKHESESSDDTSGPPTKRRKAIYIRHDNVAKIKISEVEPVESQQPEQAPLLLSGFDREETFGGIGDLRGLSSFSLFNGMAPNTEPRSLETIETNTDTPASLSAQSTPQHTPTLPRYVSTALSAQPPFPFPGSVPGFHVAAPTATTTGPDGGVSDQLPLSDDVNLIPGLRLSSWAPLQTEESSR